MPHRRDSTIFVMLRSISNLPVLMGKETDDFIKKAHDAEMETIDFSQQSWAMDKI